MYHPIKIANYMVSKSLETGIKIDLMQIVKLVYISHGWYLAYRNKPLVVEQAETWLYGPVMPSVYRRYKHFKSTINEIDLSYPIEELKADKDAVEVLDAVWYVYGDIEGGKLSTLTHQEGTPWRQAKEQKLSLIPNDMIQEYYKKFLNEKGIINQTEGTREQSPQL